MINNPDLSGWPGEADPLHAIGTRRHANDVAPMARNKMAEPPLQASDAFAVLKNFKSSVSKEDVQKAK